MAARPNILILMTDEHSPQWSGPYGNRRIHTPALDRLAAAGVTMDNAYCNSPLCVPSRMSFMTGRYVYRVGAWDNGAVLPSDAVTWAHRFAAAGYETALSGKMHFQGLDQWHGFQHRLVSEIHGAGALGALPPWRAPQGTTDPVRGGSGGGPRQRILGAGPGRGTGVAYDEAVRDAAVAFLRERPAGSGAPPFALCASFISPHFPLLAPQADFDRYWPDVPMPELPRGGHPFHGRLLDHFDLRDLTSDQVRRARAAYFGLVTFVDRLIGDVLDALEAAGLAEDTLVVYTADHGELLGEHDLWWKCCFYEHAVRVPLLLRWPGRLPAGERRAQVCSLVDLVPTLLTYANLPAGGPGDPAGPLDGDPLVDVLTPTAAGSAAAWKDEAMSEYHAHASAHPMRMLRRGRFKLNYVLDEPCELYDLDEDPGETRNLADLEAYASVREQLTRRLLAGWPARRLERRQRDERRARPLLGAGRARSSDGRGASAGRG